MVYTYLYHPFISIYRDIGDGLIKNYYIVTVLHGFTACWFKDGFKGKKSHCIPKRCPKTQQAKIYVPIRTGPQVWVWVCAHVDIHNYSGPHGEDEYSGPHGEVTNLKGGVWFFLISWWFTRAILFRKNVRSNIFRWSARILSEHPCVSACCQNLWAIFSSPPWTKSRWPELSAPLHSAQNISRGINGRIHKMS